MSERDDLAAEVEPWLQQCGSCDAGLPMGCTCPPGDYRNILLKVWTAYLAPQPGTTEDLRDALEGLRENWSLEEIVKEAIREAEWCCEVGCGSGACETCPCCCAGYCVSGRDGLPNDDPEEVGRWLEIAAEHNPAIASLRPLLAPRPVVDRETIAKAIHDAVWPNCPNEHVIYADGTEGDAADAVLALLNGGAS